MHGDTDDPGRISGDHRSDTPDHSKCTTDDTAALVKATKVRCEVDNAAGSALYHQTRACRRADTRSKGRLSPGDTLLSNLLGVHGTQLHECLITSTAAYGESKWLIKF